MMAQHNPRMIGGLYQVGQVITSGPLLTIYSAYNRYTSDVVGLYVIELPPTTDEDAVRRLFLPLEKRRLVQSPHAIHVYDWGIDGNRAYITTDPPRGLTLRQVLDTENVDVRRALNLARQMARGLVDLHAQGIVDIDMRPQLVTVDIVGVNDRAQLDDIGLRLLLKQLGYVNSQRGDDIGYLDPRYAAPEILQNGPVGAWSDVYQLGLLLYEAVTGRLPFVGRTPAETGVMQTTYPVPPVTQFNHDTPQAVQDLVDRALAKNPAQRYPNAQSLLQALETLPVITKPSTTLDNIAFTPAAGSLPAIRSGGQTSEMHTTLAKGDVTMSAAQNDRESTARKAGAGANDPRSHEIDVTLSDTLIDSEKTLDRLQADNPFATEEEGALAYLYFEPQAPQAGAIQRFAIKNNYVVVGRIDPKRGVTPEVDLSAIDTTMTVSRQHARIRYEKTFFYIEDLKSRNKTRLGELTLLPLKAELLQHGDVVHFGSVRMVFRVPGMKDKPVIKDR